MTGDRLPRDPPAPARDRSSHVAVAIVLAIVVLLLELVRGDLGAARAAGRPLPPPSRPRPDHLGRGARGVDRGLEPEAPAARLAARRRRRGAGVDRPGARPRDRRRGRAGSCATPGRCAVRAGRPPLPRRRRATRRVRAGPGRAVASATSSRGRRRPRTCDPASTASSSARGPSRRRRSCRRDIVGRHRPGAGPVSAEDPSRFAGIREYAPGDPLRRVHPRASARLGRPVVKRFEPSRDREVLIALDVQTRDGPAWETARSTPTSVESLFVVAARWPDRWPRSGQSFGLAAAGYHGAESRFAIVTPSEAPGQAERVLDLLARLSSHPSAPFERLLGMILRTVRPGTTAARPDRPRPVAVRGHLRRLESSRVAGRGRRVRPERRHGRGAGPQPRPDRAHRPPGWTVADGAAGLIVSARTDVPA